MEPKMTIADQYRKKCATADEAVATLQANETVMLPYGISQPPALIQALADRAKSGTFNQIKLYYMRALSYLGECLLQPSLTDVFKFRPLSLTKHDRSLISLSDKYQKKVIDYVPNFFSQVPRLIEENFDIDTFMVMVSPIDEDGYFNLGANVAYSLAALKKAKKVMVEVNPKLLPAAGDCRISINDIDFIVENSTALATLTERSCDEIDKRIGRYIVDLIPDGATIQVGVGGVPNALSEQLSGHKDLGIHTELLTQGMVNLIEKGVVTGKRKNIHAGEHVCTVCFGDQKIYDFLATNKQVAAYPVDYVNDQKTIAQHDNFISINSLIEIDLYGQVNVENIQGRQYNTIGGHFDFMHGAYNSKGGKSFLAFHSTVKSNTISRIVPRLTGIVSENRADVQYVVTEHGIKNLKGLSTSKRALALIELADPKFREELLRQAKVWHLV